ncbi:MAG: GDP-mannose 4,6-dehydratase [Candidatus Omnitrophica bacterium]|nr:GDP-mannose 4,6-dehydratase [Candidatus Omnitrophota bacterium]
MSLLLTLQGKKFKVFECDRKNYKRSWEFKTELSGQHYGLVKRKKQEIQYEGWVYDLEVEKSHNFVCGIGNVVCHNTHVDNSIRDPFIFEEVNVRGTLNLLACARKYKVKRFVHISTDEVYGDIEKGKFKENHPLAPNSPYSASKAAADFLVRAYVRTYGFPAVTIRPSNNYGPWQYPEKFIPVAISSVLADRKIPVYAQGLNKREWLYVTDCVRGIALVMDKGKLGEVYNLGSGVEKRNIDLAREILKLLGKDKDCIDFVTDRPGHDFRYCLDSSKISALGFSTQVDFKTGIKNTVQWYKEKRTWTEEKLGI